MILEPIGDIDPVFAAVITGLHQRLRRENDAVRGEPAVELGAINETVHKGDDQLDEMAEWQEKHQEYHDRMARMSQ